MRGHNLCHLEEWAEKILELSSYINSLDALAEYRTILPRIL